MLTVLRIVNVSTKQRTFGLSRNRISSAQRGANGYPKPTKYIQFGLSNNIQHMYLALTWMDIRDISLKKFPVGYIEQSGQLGDNYTFTTTLNFIVLVTWSAVVKCKSKQSQFITLDLSSIVASVSSSISLINLALYRFFWSLTISTISGYLV